MGNLGNGPIVLIDLLLIFRWWHLEKSELFGQPKTATMVVLKVMNADAGSTVMVAATATPMSVRTIFRGEFHGVCCHPSRKFLPITDRQ